MLVLDTDTLSPIQSASSAAGQRVRDRTNASGRKDVVTIVTVAEQLRGRLAYCAGAKTVEQYIEAVRRLHTAFRDLQGRTILDFDDRAAAEFRKLKAAKVRVGTMDLRIASVTLAVGGKLLSANLSDFRKVPGLDVEDWSA
jgi:tRNA(fMet)-specific endonuclease VapC